MNIYEKLLKVRADFSTAKITKSGVNEYAGFNYFELSDIVPTITRLCAEVKALPLINYGEGTATMRFINAEKPDEYIEITCEMREINNKKMNPAQEYGSVQTYTRRYLYLTMFDISEPDTLDALPQNEQPKSKAKQTEPPAQRPAMPQAPAPEPQQTSPKPPKKKQKPGKMSAQNKDIMNRLVKAYANASGTPVKEVVPMIEQYTGIRMSEMTDDDAFQTFAMLEKLIREFTTNTEAPQSA